MKSTTKTANWSYFGDTVLCTPAELRELFGTPAFDENLGDGNTNIEWHLEDSRGGSIRLYDWKERRRLAESEPVNWHLGATSEEQSTSALEEIAELLLKLRCGPVLDKLRSAR